MFERTLGPDPEFILYRPTLEAVNVDGGGLGNVASNGNSGLRVRSTWPKGANLSQASLLSGILRR